MTNLSVKMVHAYLGIEDVITFLIAQLMKMKKTAVS